MEEAFWFPIYEKRVSQAVKAKLRIGTILKFPDSLDDPLAQVQEHSHIQLPSITTRAEPKYVYPRHSSDRQFKMRVTEHNVNFLSHTISPKALAAIVNIPEVLEFSRAKNEDAKPVYIITGLRETVCTSFVQEAPLVKTRLEPLDSALETVRNHTGIKIPHVHREVEREVKKYLATDGSVKFAFQMHVLWPMPDGNVKMHVYAGRYPHPLNRRAIIE